ncbi:MAG: glycosyl transferase [Alteromonadaceae bacterium]|nr:MAG: glycosyl transferase [Alteromonadaceae bacterium]
MKVMHVEAGRHLYGGALQVFYLMRELKQQHGVENLLVCPEQSDIGREAQPYAQVLPCKMGGDVDFLFSRRLIKLIKQNQPDVLHVHSRRGADVWGAVAAKSTGIASVLTRRVDNPDVRMLASFKANRYTALAAISDGIRQVMLNDGVAPERVQTIRSAVDADKFSAPRDRKALKERFGYDEQDLVIAMAAQLIDRKGHRFLLEITPQLIEKYPQVKILILGKGPLESELKALSKTLGLEAHVTFAGFQTDIDKILPSVDILAHPALMEGLGVALLQTSAAGVPIVAGAAGGIPEIVRDDVNGYLTPPGDTEMLKARLMQLLGDKDLRQKLGRQGQQLAKEEFSIAQMAAKNYALYQHVLATKKTNIN